MDDYRFMTPRFVIARSLPLRSRATKQSRSVTAEIATACFAGLAMTEAAGREPSQYPGLGRMSMNDIRLQLAKQLLNLKVAYRIIKRIDSPTKPVNNHDRVTLSLCLVEKLALRPQCRPGYQRDIMPPLRQDFTRYNRILLRTTED